MEIPASLNIGQYILEKNILAGRGGKVAVRTQSREYTYDELDRASNQFGNALKNLGIRREQRILLLLPDKPEFIISFLGAIKIGAVPVPVSTMLKPKEYAYYLHDSCSRILVIDSKLLEQLEDVLPDARDLQFVIVAEDEFDATDNHGKKFGANIKCLNFNDIVGEQSDKLLPELTSKDDMAFWIYSSGSTGRPKGTVHLQHDIYYAAECLASAYYGIQETDICYSVSKMFFAYGLGNSFWLPFWEGASSYLYAAPSSPQAIIELVSNRKPSMFWGVPSFYNAVLNYIDTNNVEADFSSVGKFFSAGEVLSSVLFERWQRLTGKPIYTVLGSTEALQGYIAVPLDGPRPGTLGKPIPGYDARIVNDDGIEVAAGETGTIRLKGDSVASQYWNQHEKSKATFVGEWLNTGDRGYQDEDGWFWYVGRNDDMMKVGGLWVSPTEVEEALVRYEAVKECAVVKGADSQNLTYPIAFMVLKENYQVVGNQITEDIKDFIKKQIEPYKYPRAVVLVTELPRSSTGKVQRFQLRSLADQEAEGYRLRKKGEKNDEKKPS